MDQNTVHVIDQLLIDSGLFYTTEPPTQYATNFDFSEEIILITGAAGTIGGELSRQLMAGLFKKLILVDNAESPLYSLFKSFEQKNKNNVEFLLLNINDINSLEYLFECHKPSMVFHAAAYKHVPLMEAHPFEAIRTNIFGTKQLAEFSIKHGVKKFIFVSTDKAVNPVGIMGMTKRIAEQHLNDLNAQHETAFFNTRFGNILGSNGSVVPLVKEQLKTKAPITLTDENVSRYFICKRKACNLILEIAQFNKNGENTFTFNMGQPIKIKLLVERLIKLYDKSENNFEIKYTGLRPGEKLYEDIISKDEILVPTAISDILTVRTKKPSAKTPIDFTALQQITLHTPNTKAKAILMQLIT